MLGDWLGYAWDIYTSRQDRIRYSGWILDTLGLISIAIGISSKLDRFEGKNLLEYAIQNIIAFLSKCPLISKETIILTKPVNLKVSPSSISSFSTETIDPSRPTNEKINWLLKNHNALTEAVQSLIKHTENNTKKTEEKIQKLSANLSKNIEHLKEESADVHIGDVGKEFVGLAWVFCGITFATVPEWIEAWFSMPISWFENLLGHIKPR